jgi:hypothetical protein
MVPEIGLVGEGDNAMEAYQNLISFWERNHDLFRGGIQDRSSLVEVVKQERKWKWLRNILISVCIVLGGLVATDAVFSSILRFPKSSFLNIAECITL